MSADARSIKEVIADLRQAVRTALQTDWEKWKAKVDSPQLDPERVASLSKACAVLHTFARLSENSPCTQWAFSHLAAKVLGETRIEFLPKNADSLNVKLSRVRKGVPVEFVISGINLLTKSEETEKREKSRSEKRAANRDNSKPDAHPLQTPIETSIENAVKRGWKKYAPLYENYSPKKAKELSVAAAVLSNLSGLVKAQICGKTEINIVAGKIVAARRLRYVPRNGRRLSNKIDAVLAGTPIEQVARLPREGLKNAQKKTSVSKALPTRFSSATNLSDCNPTPRATVRPSLDG